MLSVHLLRLCFKGLHYHTMNTPKEDLITLGGFPSRFKIVKIESKKTLRRGRWICNDFNDPVSARRSDEPVSGLYCVPGSGDTWSQPFIATIVYSDGRQALEPVHTDNHQTALEPYASLKINGDNCLVCISDLQSDLMAICDETSLSEVVWFNLCKGKLPVKHCHLLPNQHLDVDVLSTVCIDECQPMSTVLVVSASDHSLIDSNSAIFAIDSKIEQAMDLLKSHLMYAVHQEVQILKEKISDLTLENMRLEDENRLLREAILPDVLSSAGFVSKWSS